jgi:hypothetical protein
VQSKDNNASPQTTEAEQRLFDSFFFFFPLKFSLCNGNGGTLCVEQRPKRLSENSHKKPSTEEEEEEESSTRSPPGMSSEMTPLEEKVDLTQYTIPDRAAAGVPRSDGDDNGGDDEGSTSSISDVDDHDDAAAVATAAAAAGGTTGCWSHRGELVRLVSVAATTAATLGYDVGIMAAAIQPIEAEMELTGVQKELAMGSLNFVAALGAVAAGRTADTYGRKFTVSLTCRLFLAGTACMALAPSYAFLLLGRIVCGLGACALWSVHLCTSMLRFFVVFWVHASPTSQPIFSSLQKKASGWPSSWRPSSSARWPPPRSAVSSTACSTSPSTVSGWRGGGGNGVPF